MADAKATKCPFLNTELHIEGCPAFEKGCPFKDHTCPFKDMSREDAMAMLCKCPNLQAYLNECPAYNPDREGCPFDHQGKMDISKCPIFKSHVAEAEFEKKFGHECPYLNKFKQVEGCPAFEHGCPFKERQCPYKDMTHEDAIEMMAKCPHLKEHLAKCPKYNPNKADGCPFEGNPADWDITKCPHFAHHFQEHRIIPQIPHPKPEEKKESAPHTDLPAGHAAVEGGDESKCPYLQMKKKFGMN